MRFQTGSDFKLAEGRRALLTKAPFIAFWVVHAHILRIPRFHTTGKELIEIQFKKDRNLRPASF